MNMSKFGQIDLHLHLDGSLPAETILRIAKEEGIRLQAAGRCNRHGEAGMGYVYIVGISSELENVERLAEIRKMQESMAEVLNQFRKNPEIFDLSQNLVEAIPLTAGSAAYCAYQSAYLLLKEASNIRLRKSRLP